MIYDSRGREVYAEDVLDAEELAEYRAARRQPRHVRYARTTANDVERAEREHEAALDRPWEGA